MAPPDPLEKDRTSAVIPLDVILQVLGAGAAIVAWIVVVGGARLWARLEAADIPATQTLAVLPKSVFIVEGLQILTLPVLLGAAVALLVYYSRREGYDAQARKARRLPGDFVVVWQHPGSPSQSGQPGSASAREAPAWRRPIAALREYANVHTDGELIALTVLTAVGVLLVVLTVVHAWGWPLVAILEVAVVLAGASLMLGRDQQRAWLVLSAFVLIGGIGGLLLWQVRLAYLAAMVAITAAAIWLTLGGAMHTKQAAGVAWTLFAAFVLWCGALAFVRERGQRHVTYDLVRIDFNAPGRDDESGLYIGRSSDQLLYAVPTGNPPKHGRAVVAVNNDDIQSVSYGARLDIPNQDVVDTNDKPETTPNSPSNPGSGGQPGGGNQPGHDEQEPDMPTDRGAGRPAKILDSADGHIDRVPARIELTTLKLADGLLRLNLRVVNRADPHASGARSLRIGGALDDRKAGDRGRDDSLDGIQVIDAAHAKRYDVSRDDSGICGCDDHLTDAAVGPHDFMALSAVYRVSQLSAKVDVFVPRFGTLQDVVVQRSR